MPPQTIVDLQTVVDNGGVEGPDLGVENEQVLKRGIVGKNGPNTPRVTNLIRERDQGVVDVADVPAAIIADLGDLAVIESPNYQRNLGRKLRN